MLEIGKNTYCTLEDANRIVKETYPIGSNAAYWDGLDDEQKENLLIESAEEMELLPVAGVKLFYNQPLQFPRRSMFYRQNDIPREVKDAQVINALDMLLVELGIKQQDGSILTSKQAEKELRRWTSGGFKMGGIAKW